MKQINAAIYIAYLFICSFVFTSITPVIAADANTQKITTYQSSFDDFKPSGDDSLYDWKSINSPRNGNSSAGHSMAGMSNMDSGNMKGMDHSQMKHDHAMAPMAGMQHNMTPEQMANMPSGSKEMPEMKGMDHSNMAGMSNMDSGNMKSMDHSQMKQNKDMAPMAGMQHNMTPEQMANMPSGSKEMPEMKGMDHSNMAGMAHDNMNSMSESKSAMPEMSHDEMAGHDHGESMANDMQPGHEVGVKDESQPHEHTAIEESEHKMAMSSMTPAIQATPWQIIPNPHPMVVHFPIALTIVAFLLSIAAYARRSHPVSLQLAAAGHFTLWIAAVSAAVAVLFGWFAYNSVNHDEAGHVAMLLHRSWAVPTALGLIFLASWDAWKYRVNELISVPMLFVLFLLSQSIAVTGWLGGEVVYRHGIGVLALPTSEGDGHSHHHIHDSTEPEGHLHEERTTHPDETSDHHYDEKGESHEY